MRKTVIIIAILFPGAAFAVMPVLAPSMHTEPLEQSQSASAIGTHRAQTSDQLSMGPDPGGKTGATVTPTTTKTGQPSSRGSYGNLQPVWRKRHRRPGCCKWQGRFKHKPHQRFRDAEAAAPQQ